MFYFSYSNYFIKSYYWLNHLLKTIADNRLTVFIGILSLLVAIIVYIAQYISSKENTEIEKTSYLAKFKINRILEFSVLTLFYLWLLDVIENTSIGYNFILEFSGFLCIINVAYSICKVFAKTLMLSCNKGFQNGIIKEYVEQKFKEYNTTKAEFNNKIWKNKEEFRDYIYNHKGFISYNSGVVDKNARIFIAKQNGYFERINTELLDEIYLKFKNKEIYKKGFIPLIFLKNIGEKIEIGDKLFYYHLPGVDLSNLIIFNNSNAVNQSDINNCIINLIKKYNNDLEFDDDKLLTDIFLKLLAAKDKETITIFCNQFFEEFNISFETKSKLTNNQILTLQKRINFFLCKIGEISKTNSDIFDTIINIVCKQCYKGILFNDDSVNFTYYYINHVYNVINTFIEYINKPTALNISASYSNNLCSFLNIIVKLFENNKNKEANILIDNTYLFDSTSDFKESNTEFMYSFTKLVLVMRLRANKYNSDIAISEHYINKVKCRFEECYNYHLISIIDILDLTKSTRKEKSKLLSNCIFWEFLLLKDEGTFRYSGKFYDDYEIILYMLIYLNNCIEFNMEPSNEFNEIISKIEHLCSDKFVEENKKLLTIFNKNYENAIKEIRESLFNKQKDNQNFGKKSLE